MNRPSFFPTKFFADAVDGVAEAAAGYQLATFLAGTTTPATTYQDVGGATPNEQPIPLDENGECDLFLDPTVNYKLVLLLPIAQGSGEVRVYDNVVGAASTLGVVTSVNGLTGVVVLEAEDIPYTPTVEPTWLSVTNVGEGLDALVQHFEDLTAADVPLVDAGGNFPPEVTNVEEALAQLADAATAGAGGRLLRLTVINVSGANVWEKLDDVGSILVRAIGGGGGGGVGGGGDGGTGGGGGGAGGYCERRIVAPTTPITVTIGAGGASGVAGGDTTFGTYFTAGGGNPGLSISGGEGGLSTGGDVNLRGGAGGLGLPGFAAGRSGCGGSSALGGGGKTTTDNHESGGYPADANTGGGGGGGTGAGGAGGSGLVLIYEYS